MTYGELNAMSDQLKTIITAQPRDITRGCIDKITKLVNYLAEEQNLHDKDIDAQLAIIAKFCIDSIYSS